MRMSKNIIKRLWKLEKETLLQTREDKIGIRGSKQSIKKIGKSKKLKARIAKLEQSTSGQEFAIETNHSNEVGSGGGNEDAGTAFGGRNGKKKLKFSQITTKNRIIKQIGVIAPVTSNVVHTNPTEMDSHADTIVAGRNTIVLSYTDRV